MYHKNSPAWKPRPTPAFRRQFQRQNVPSRTTLTAILHKQPVQFEQNFAENIMLEVNTNLLKFSNEIETICWLMFVKLRGRLSNGFVCRVLQIPTVSNRENC